MTSSAPPEPSPALRFVALVLELEGELLELSRTLEEAGVAAVLLNGGDVRPALARGFAFAFAAEVEVPRAQVPRALGAMEQRGWTRRPGRGGPAYFRRGVVVRLRARRGGAPGGGRPLASGRLGFAEPADRVAEHDGPPAAVPLDPGAPLRTGFAGAALAAVAEARTGWDTARLRTRELSFRGLPFQYGPGVHGFEPQTSSLVDGALARLPGGGGARIVDVGTGCGIVALSLARERPDADVLGTEVSLRALGWARRNRRRLGCRNVRLAQGSLLAPVPPGWRGTVDAVATNPPMAMPARAIELRGFRGWPVGSATGPGADGLGLVRALARDALAVLAPGGHLHLHLLAEQAAWIVPYLTGLGYEAEVPPEAASARYTAEVVARRPPG